MKILIAKKPPTSVQFDSVKYGHIVLQWISRVFPSSSLSDFKKLLPKKKKRSQGILSTAACANDTVKIRAVHSHEKLVSFRCLSPYWLDLNKSCGCLTNDFLEVLGHYGDEENGVGGNHSLKARRT